MATPDQTFDRDIDLLKKAMTPSASLRGRIRAVTGNTSPRYPWWKFLVLVPALGVMIAFMALRGTSHHEDGSDIATLGNEFINTMVLDAQAEQTIIAEADSDITVTTGDEAQLDTFAGQLEDEY